MVPYITRRIFLLVYVLLGVSLTIFLLMRLIPGVLPRNISTS